MQLLFYAIYLHICSLREPGSPVCTVFVYGLDDREIKVRSPAEATDFFLWPVCPDRSGAHPAPVQSVPGVLPPGLNRGRGVTLTTHLRLVQRSRMSGSYTSSPPKRVRGV
jgi:hypothetical protein